MKFDKNKFSGLLNLASQKLGTTPEKLQSQLQNGDFSTALNSMSPAEQQKIKMALSDPKMAEKILSTKQAKDMYNNLSKK